MKKILFLATLLPPVLMLSSCGYSVFDAAEDVQKVASSEWDDAAPIPSAVTKTDLFTKIEANGPDTVNFVTGETFSISATGDAETLKRLRYKVKDGAISIGRVNGSWASGSDKNALITVTAPTISALVLAGSGSINADRLTGAKMIVEIAGSGSAKIDEVTGDELKGEIAGSGQMTVAGKVAKSVYSIAGSGRVNADRLITTDAKVETAGSGDVNINASGTVKAELVGSGQVNVQGGATCSSDTVGSGELSCS